MDTTITNYRLLDHRTFCDPCFSFLFTPTNEKLNVSFVTSVLLLIRYLTFVFIRRLSDHHSVFLTPSSSLDYHQLPETGVVQGSSDTPLVNFYICQLSVKQTIWAVKDG